MVRISGTRAVRSDIRALECFLRHYGRAPWIPALWPCAVEVVPRSIIYSITALRRQGLYGTLRLSWRAALWILTWPPDQKRPCTVEGYLQHCGLEPSRAISCITALSREVLSFTLTRRAGNTSDLNSARRVITRLWKIWKRTAR